MKIAQEILEFFKLEEAQMDASTAFKTLGLTHGDYDGVDKAFKKMAMTHHPDRGGDPEMMKKINQAKDALAGGTGSAKSKDDFMKDVVAKNQVRIAKAKVVTKYIFDNVDNLIKNFAPELAAYFQKNLGKEYSFEVKSRLADNEFDPSQWAGVPRDARNPFDGHVEWKLVFNTKQRDSQFILDLTAHIDSNVIEKALNVEGLDIEMNFETYAYNDGKRTKMQQKRWGYKAKASSLGEPDDFFPLKKIAKMVSSEKTRLTKRTDAFSLMKTEFKALYPYTDKDVLHLPISDDVHVKLRRSIMLKVGFWTIQDLVKKEGPYKYTSMLQPKQRVDMQLTDIIEMAPDFADTIRKSVKLIGDQQIDKYLEFAKEKKKEFYDVIWPQVQAKTLK